MSAGLREEARVRRVRRDEWGGEMECVWRLWGSDRSAGYVDFQHEGETVEEAECTLERLVGNRVWSIRGTWLEHSHRWKYCAGGQGRR